MAIKLNIDYDTKDANASLEKLKRSTQNALNSSATSVQKLGVQLQQTTQKIESTQAEMEKLAKTNIINPEYKETIKDIRNVEKAIDSLNSRMDDMQKDKSAYTDEYKALADDVSKYKDALFELEDILSELKEKGVPVDSKLTKEAAFGVSMYQRKIREANEQLHELENTGEAYTSPFLNARKEAEQYANTLSNLQSKKANLEVGGNMMISGSDSARYQQLANNLSIAQTRAGILQRTLENMNTTGAKTVSGLASGFRKVGQSIKNHFSNHLEDSQQKLKGLGKGILKYVIGVRSLFLLYRKLREAGKEAFTNLGNQFPEIQSQLNSLSASFGQVKNSIATAFQPIFSVAVPALVTLMNYLVSAMNTLANFFATLTGQKYIYKATKSVNNMNKAIGGSGAAAKEANKQLAEYDKLIVIPQDTGGGGGGGGGGGDVDGGSFEKVATQTSKLAEMIKEAWTLKDGDFTDVGKYIGDQICDGLESIPWGKIKATAHKAGKSLATLLNGLISPRLGYDLGKTLAESLNTAVEFLATFAEELDWANVGKSIAESINGFFKNFDFKRLAQGISAFVDGLADALWAFVSNIDWGQLLIDAMDFVSGLSIKTITIGIGAFWFLHGGVKQTIAQLGSGLFTKVSTSLTTAFGVSPITLSVSIILSATIGWKIGTKIYETLSGHEVTQSFREEIVDIWEGFTKDKIKFDLGEFIEFTFSEDTPLNQFLGTVKETESTLDEFSKHSDVDFTRFYRSARIASDDASNSLTDIRTSATNSSNAIASGFNNCGENLKSKWNDIKGKFSDAGGYFKDKFTDGFEKAKGSWSTAKQSFGEVWKGIQSNFGTTASWFRGTFETAWTNVKNVFSKGGKVFSGIKEGVADTFRTIVNTLIDGINKVVAIPFNAIDRALSRLRNTSIAGISPFGWLPSISTPQLPHLAQGAVIPPNKEFLAVLGDQKQGTNIETPLDTMIQAFKIAFNEVGGNSGNNNPIVLQLNGKEVAEVVWDEEEKRYKQTGSYRPQYS